MSRPCFALSVMLCCMGAPLLIIGKAQARDPIVSPGHDPGECILCPLAYAPYDVCGGYSDYDYNQYWNAPPAESDATPAEESAPELAGPQLNEVESLPSVASDDAWDADYEDYYADYVFGTAEEEIIDRGLAETEQSSEVQVDPEPLASTTLEEPQSDAAFELYDEFGWYSDEADLTDDVFDSYDEYEPIVTSEPEASPEDEPSADYESYEEEWFYYGEESTFDASNTELSDTGEANESRSEPTDELELDASNDHETIEPNWGDEEAWYNEEYGYDAVEDEEGVSEVNANDDAIELAETGYDKAYDEAMDLEVAEPVADSSTNDVEYESFYDAYDDLYNFESTSYEAPKSELEDRVLDPVAGENEPNDAVTNPAWLQKLVDRMLSPVWTVTGDAAEALTASYSAAYADECAQEWDCEADYWARPQTGKPSVALSRRGYT